MVMSDFIDVTSRETSRLLSISRSRIGKAVGAEIHRGYQESMKNTGEVLTLVLEKTLRDSENVA
jgi:hypothetical protein